MATIPETRYAKTQHAHIAYRIVGSGAIDVVYMGGGYVPMDEFDEEPTYARFLRRLAGFSRLIEFDKRGVGRSDPISVHEPPTLEESAADVVTVLDAAGSETAAVIGVIDDGLTALVLAALHPERVGALVLVNASARVARAPDYLIGFDRELVGNLESGIDPDPGAGALDMLALSAPSRVEDARFREWFERAGQRGASPATARALARRALRCDARAMLPRIRVPTLVLHRSELVIPPVEHGRYLAEHIPDARYVELPGAGTLVPFGDADAVLDEIEEFLTGGRTGAEPDRALATVLFTDIVASTEHAARLGDRRWRELLDEHDSMVRRQLARFGGREIKSTGDGVLATFPVPSRGVECAAALRVGARGLNIAIRAGVHTGEVEVRGADIGGMAVNIAARIAALAQSDEILVSGTCKDLAAGSQMVFSPRGTYTLRGVPGQWQVFAVSER